MADSIPTLQSFESRLLERLLETQDDASGGWAEHPGGKLSAFNTAEAVMALSVTHSVTEVPVVQQSIRRAVGFLLSERDSDPMSGPDSGAWYRRGAKGTKVADIIRTAMVVNALINAGERTDNPALASAVDWVVKRQNTADIDSGWAYQRGAKSEILPTCFALLALIAASTTTDGNPWKDSIENGLKHLAERLRNKEGSFGSGALTAAHTVYSCLILQAARAAEFRIVPKTESDAIRWLLSHQDDALSPIEELIAIDATCSADYPYMFSMESLLLRVLGNSQESRDRGTKLWLDVQRAVRADFDEITGGFYGRRVFSWSTAHGLYSIKASEDKLKAIPPRPEEDPSGLKVGNAILVLVFALVASVVYLTATGKFANLQAIFFGGLVLACLLAYGKIGEKTFAQLISALMGAKKGEPEHSSNA